MNDKDLRDTLRLVLRYIDRNDRGLRDEAMAILRRMDDEARAEVAPQVARPNIEMVTVPEGEFLYGAPPVSASLPTYQIAKYPLTNAQYKAFLDATGHPAPPGWDGRDAPTSQDKHPVVNISWHDAVACAAWYGMRLPTEQEWEKAARGTDGRVYPWGDKFDRKRCNTGESGRGGTSDVFAFTHDFSPSPYGCYDMVGNVWEWTDSVYEPERNSRVVRGGSWGDPQDLARCSFPYGFHPDLRYYFIGVRFSRTPLEHLICPASGSGKMGTTHPAVKLEALKEGKKDVFRCADCVYHLDGEGFHCCNPVPVLSFTNAGECRYYRPKIETLSLACSCAY